MTPAQEPVTTNANDTVARDHGARHPPSSTDGRYWTSLAKHLPIPVVAAAQLLSGLFAGFFVTYQISIIRAFARIDDPTYVLAFQSINNTIRSAEFGVIFFGTAPMILLALLIGGRSRSSAQMWLAAALVLAVVTLIITFLGNIPLNDALGAVDAANPKFAMQGRLAFEASWNSLNLIRTLTALGTAFCVNAGALSLHHTKP